MEIRITRRVEGGHKPAPGVAGAFGATSPVGVTETSIELIDVDADRSGAAISQATHAMADLLAHVGTEAPEAPKTYDGEEL